MARPVERIEQDIAELEQAVAELAQEFQHTYTSYLTTFGQAVRQQLILAGYYICTQGHPDPFLKLSYNQRQQLQQDLRMVAVKAQQQLLAELHSPAVKETAELSLPLVGLPTQLELQETESLTPFNPLSVQSEPEQPLGTPLETILQPELNSGLEEISANPTFPTLVPEPTGPLNNPEQLAKWQEKLERSIIRILQTASRRANRLLQQAGVLSKKLPEPVLEAAAKAESSAETVAGPPNLLNLLVETESSEEPSGSTVAQLLAIHLRLSEIEFADSTVMAGRAQIRKLSAKLTQLGRDYQKKRRERAIAEAEAAWRASWVDK